MTKKIVIAMLAWFALSPAAFAVEALSTAELVLHCEKYHEPDAEEDRIFCVRYIQGFIDGAVATDERVTRNVAMEYEKSESFSERAKRTRVGSRLDRYGATVYADYCLGDPVPLREVVEQVVEDARDPSLIEAHPLARELVYRTLRTHYPCEG